jgi:hypothetical protein
MRKILLLRVVAPGAEAKESREPTGALHGRPVVAECVSKPNSSAEL